MSSVRLPPYEERYACTWARYRRRKSETDTDLESMVASLSAFPPNPMSGPEFGTKNHAKGTMTRARLHFSQPRWRRIRSSMVITGQAPQKKPCVADKTESRS